MGRTRRIVGIAVSGTALALALYMSWLAASDAAARRILSGEAARSFAAQACAAIAECKAIKLEGGFDWTRAERRVVYTLTLAAGAPLGRAKEELRERGARQDGLLGWALRPEPVLNVQRVRSRAPASKGGRK